MASKSFCKGSKFSYIGLNEVELPVSERSEYPRFFVLQNDASRNPRALARGRNASNQIISQKTLDFP